MAPKKHTTAPAAARPKTPPAAATAKNGADTKSGAKKPSAATAATATNGELSSDELQRLVTSAADSLAESRYTHVSDDVRYKTGQPIPLPLPAAASASDNKQSAVATATAATGGEYMSRLYIGGLGAAQNGEWLSAPDVNIRFVVDVGSGNTKTALKDLYAHRNIQVLKFDPTGDSDGKGGSLVDADTTDLRAIFDTCHAFIHRATPLTPPPQQVTTVAASGGADAKSTATATATTTTTAATATAPAPAGVLVHCYQGMSRSATIVISYLMRCGGLTMRDAMAQVVKARPLIRPNDGFLAQLIRYEHELNAGTALRTIPSHDADADAKSNGGKSHAKHAKRTK